MTQQEINNSSMLKVGTILRGTYRIDSYLSSGGFGNTYVATNIEFDERIAIKEFFIKGVTQRDDNQTTVSVSNSENTNSFLEQKEKFKKEARRIRQLKNEHIVAVHDLFEENGTAYYVMDYVDGENLSEHLKRTGRAMTESEIRDILPQILDALKAVHNEGFCHLDIKPSNIMLEKGGKIKLIDFGASKQLGANGTLTTNAPTAFAQTPGYAPREQMEQNLDKIGPWTDIYALGATLYNLLTNNKPPLPSDIDDDMSEDKHNALPFPESVGEMKYLVLQIMKTNRLQRPQNIDAIISAEKAYLSEKETRDLTPQQKAHYNSLPLDDNEKTIVETKPVNKEYQTYEKASTKQIKKQESNSNKTVINYLEHPFKHSWIYMLVLLFIVCALVLQIPEFFYTFGEYNNALETFTFGSFQLVTFIPFEKFVQDLFFFVIICMTIPLIIGVRPFSKTISNLLILSQLFLLILIGNEKLVAPSIDAWFSLYLVDRIKLNWVCFNGYLLLYFICGILMVYNYKGKIVLLGKIYTLYPIFLYALIILQDHLRIPSFVFEIAIFLWVLGMWWMLTRKPIDIKV